MIYLPDTNTLSRFMRAKDAGLRDKLLEHVGSCRLSSIVLAELEYGAAKRADLPQIAMRVEMLSKILRLAAFDAEAAWHTGRVRAYLEMLKPNAQPIGPYDTQIAGHALALGATVVTHNTNEFRRIPGLAVEDWQGET